MKTNAVALLVTALLLVTANEAQADRWTAADSAAQGLVLLSLAIDYHQTQRIIDDPLLPEHRESNPVMGARGERMRPEAYFAGVAVLHTVAVTQLPQPYRRIAQGIMLTVQVKAVTHNMMAGYAIQF